MTAPDNLSGTAKANLKATRILCIGLIAGIFLFAMISLLVNTFMGPFINGTKMYSSIFLWIVATISSICILVAITKYPKSIRISQNAISLNDKLNYYRAALIIYMALCEGPALFSIILFLLTGNLIAFAFTTIMLGMMLIKFPTIKRAIAGLQLDWQEQLELENIKN